MGFTGSHPAAVLPLLRRGRWVTAALVSGSVAPDLPSFVPVGFSHEQTHPLGAILWPDLPLAAGLLLAWWVLFRPGLALLWPEAARRTGPPDWSGALHRGPVTARTLGWAGWLVVSLIVGLATHLAWDAFTHAGGYMVVHWPLLSDRIAKRGVYTWLQLVTSAIGLAFVLAYLALEWRRRAAHGPGPADGDDREVRPGLRLTVVGLTLAATAVGATLRAYDAYVDPNVGGRFWVSSVTIKGGGTGLVLALSLWSVLCLVARPAVTRPRAAVPPT